MNTNPFNDYGGTVTGERFIGRKSELRTITDRVFATGGFGSVSIVGLPRVGKTSLVAEAMRRNEKAILDLHAVSIFIDVGTQGSAHDLFSSIVRLLTEKLLDIGCRDELIRRRAEEMADGAELRFEQLTSYLRLVRGLGFRVVCVLDEFDAGRNLFRERKDCFYWLRNLCSTDPAYKIALIIVSKRPLDLIARMAGHDSNYWANALERINLHSFSDAEFNEFMQHLGKRVGKLPTELIESVLCGCGKLPFLLDAFACETVRAKHADMDLDIPWFEKCVRSKILGYYRDLRSLLESGGELEAVLQAIVGPQHDITREKVEDLIAYGVLTRNAECNIAAFAPDFEKFLEGISADYPFWPLWHDTERALRACLTIQLETFYGNTWPENYKKFHIKQARVVEDIEVRHRQKAKTEGEPLLNYAYPMELFNIMVADWSNFGQPLLGRDKNYWSSRFELLTRIRNPLAHNNDEIVTDCEIQQAEGLCREILDKIS